MSNALLTTRGVQAFYGKIQALKGIDLDVKQGEIVTLIGSNGAGKTTLMMTIAGILRARSGSVAFAGRGISSLRPHAIVAAGVLLGARTLDRDAQDRGRGGNHETAEARLDRSVFRVQR